MFFFFAQLTDPASQETGRWETKKRNILLGWPKIFREISEKLHNAFLSKGRGASVAAGLNVIIVCSGFKQVQNPCDVSGSNCK